MGWNILIVGAGAIGCLVGGKLAQAGQQVTLVGRPAFVEQVRGHGLQLADAQGSQRIRSLRVAADLLEAYERSPSAFDLAIFTVKCYDTAAAVDELRQALAATGAPPPALLSVQNGIGNEALLGQLVPTAPVLAGSLTTPVSVVAPGSIRVDKPSYGLGLAVWRGSQADAQAVGSLLAQAGFVVTSYADAAALKWTKLLMNLLGNATSAILDEPPQQIFADRRMVDLEIAAWREALAVILRSAWLIRRAWRPMWESPMSPSSSALGTRAATESMTIRSTAPERTRVSAISRACSPASGWEMTSSSTLTPSLRA